MNDDFQESHAFYDRPNMRVTLHHRFKGEFVLRIVFNFKDGEEDHIDGCLRDYLPMPKEAEAVYMRERRKHAWERLCKVSVY